MLRSRSSQFAILMNFLLLSWGGAAAAQGDEPFGQIDPRKVIIWTAGGAFYDEITGLEVVLNLVTKDDFSVYTSKLKIVLEPDNTLTDIKLPPTRSIVDPIGGDHVDVLSAGEVVANAGKLTLPLPETITVNVTSTGCTTKICLFPFTTTLTMPVLAKTRPAPTDLISEAAEKSSSELKNSDDFESGLAARLTAGEFSFWGLLIVCLLGGLATNLTPCVAPMIPITVRLLSQHKEGAWLSGILYGLGIVLTYTLLGAAASLSGKAFGTFMSHPGVNLAFAGVMAFLGAAMLGFGDLSALQSLGARIGAGKPSLKNAFLMGTGAGLVAAPCTGPILGALLAYTASTQAQVQGIVLMAVYSLGLALPYMVLGSLAAKATSRRVPPVIQIAVKYLFASVMFGLVLYYLRVPFYGLLPLLRSHWGEIAVGGLLVGSVAALVCIIHPKLQFMKAPALVPTILLGLGLFGGSQWLTAVDHSSSEASLQWYTTLAEAEAAAKQSGKPVLIDNWAEWCEACKKMEVTTFRDPKVMEELATHWIVVKLDLTIDSDETNAHLERFAITGLPTLTMLNKDFDVAKKKNIIGYVSGPALLNRLLEFRE